jgi:hypothetical protein
MRDVKLIPTITAKKVKLTHIDNFPDMDWEDSNRKILGSYVVMDVDNFPFTQKEMVVGEMIDFTWDEEKGPPYVLYNDYRSGLKTITKFTEYIDLKYGFNFLGNQILNMYSEEIPRDRIFPSFVMVWNDPDRVTQFPPIYENFGVFWGEELSDTAKGKVDKLIENNWLDDGTQCNSSIFYFVSCMVATYYAGDLKRKRKGIKILE